MTETPEQPTPPDQPPQPERPAPPPAVPAASGLDVTPSTPEVAYPNYPVQLDVGYQQEYNRWLPLVKWLLAIPHYFVLLFLAIGAFFGIVVAAFAVLFTGRYPEGIFGFVVGVVRWAMRVIAYTLLLVDPYPPFSLEDDPDYPVRFNVDYPSEGKIARWRPFFAWIPALPQLIIGNVVVWVAYLLQIVAFFTILFTKQIPRGIFDFMVNAQRYNLRANAYTYALTEKYPAFAWG